MDAFVYAIIVANVVRILFYLRRRQFLVHLRKDVYHLRSYLGSPAHDALLAVLSLLRKTNDKLSRPRLRKFDILLLIISPVNSWYVTEDEVY